MSLLYMFRLKAFETAQGSLFETPQSRTQFISQLIVSKPSAELRKGYIWHIGNVRIIDASRLVFAAGRTTKTSKELYDEDTGNFVAVEEEESPFTYVFFDSAISVLGIVPKTRLSPTVKGIGRNLERLLNMQASVQNNRVRIEISEIWDPEDFLQQIHAAYALVGFTVEFGEPNPFDVERDFHGPMQRYLGETGGQKGKTTVQGNDLDRDNVEKITRSVASTGNDAKARLRRSRGQRPVTRHMRGDPVNMPLQEGDLENPRGLLQRIRKAYERVRRHSDE